MVTVEVSLKLVSMMIGFKFGDGCDGEEICHWTRYVWIHGHSDATNAMGGAHQRRL